MESDLQCSTKPMRDEVYNRCLVLNEDSVLGGQGLPQDSLLQPTILGGLLKNIDYLQEISYNTYTLAQLVSNNESSLMNEQLTVYHHILTSTESDAYQLFFLDAPDETASVKGKERSWHCFGYSILWHLCCTAGGRQDITCYFQAASQPHACAASQNKAMWVMCCGTVIVWEESTKAYKGVLRHSAYISKTGRMMEQWGESQCFWLESCSRLWQ